MIYDFAIIGSGVSGGRIAFDLSKAGAKCILIEAGKEYNSQTFPNNELDYSARLFWGGGLEVSADGGMGFLRAKCVGGTSIVNQALLDRFDDMAWQDWKDRSGIDFFHQEAMERYYLACENELSVSPVPAQNYNSNTNKFIQAFEAKGFGWKPLRRAQRDCRLDKGTDCIVCLGGCPRDSKQSALITTIAWGRRLGLEVESEYEVSRVIHRKNEVQIDGVQKGAHRKVLARRAVLAAGALGNSAILLRSDLKRDLPALGTGFACHPQFMTYAYFNETIDAHKGAFQAVKSDDPRLRRAGLKLENVFAPPIGTSMLLPGVGLKHLQLMKKYRSYASMEVAIRDQPSGTITLNGSRIQISKGFTPEDREKVHTGVQLVRDLFAEIGATETVSCPQSFGLHLMGGCPIGTDSAKSVVAPDFSVHDYPNFYAADSSIFPSAPGINPSFTIMALSQKASETILKNHQGAQS